MSESQDRPAARAGRDKPSGWLLFSAMMMFGLGTFALMAAIADVLNSAWVLDNSIFGSRLDWYWYGFFDLLVALGSFYAGWTLGTGRMGAPMIALIFATLSAGRWFLLILKAPFWSITMVVLWCLVIYGLTRIQDDNPV